ncbi:ABC transporter substrate-binding protein [Aquihabitans daechungensis]|uniref:ABC transporter substrate-binding protein n=1 Tax=Aquihabitans daechungensis TaxID=1052257 RepID=UPI003BA246D1
MSMLRSRRPRRGGPVAAAALIVALLAASCGGEKASDGESGPPDKQDSCLEVSCGESGLEEAGEPQRGGTIVYGIEAESSGGFCIPEAQLAISGQLVVRAIYDPLTVPNADGGYSPYLAESITPNDDFTEWTIEVRDGVTFHDGSKLTGEVVKNNIDANRGKYPTRKPLLASFTLGNIDTVTAEGQTVTVTTKVPWVAFPAFLNGGNRFGIMAQAQLDDTETCDRKLIGTGPFKFEDWAPNDRLRASRNEDYWQIAPDGEPYPYADAIEFRVLADFQVRLNSLASSDGINIMHTSNAEAIGGELLDRREAGEVNMVVSEASAETTFIQLNNTQPPFDDIRMRKALAVGLDRDELNDTQNDGLPTVADGPFAPDTSSYVEDPGFPDFDPEEAKALIADYEADGGKAKFTLTTGVDPATLRFAELIQQRAKKVGFDISLVKRDQAAIIDDAIGKKYQAMLFRNFPGGDPDGNYVWWYGEDNPVNFSGYNDPDINRLLDEGRSETDPEKRQAIYQEINGVFAEQVYSIWAWFTPWAVVEDAKVHGVFGPPLPGEDASKPGKTSTDDPALQPTQGLANGHALHGLWVEQ